MKPIICELKNSNVTNKRHITIIYSDFLCVSQFISLTDMFFVLQWSGTAKLTTIRNLLPI